MYIYDTDHEIDNRIVENDRLSRNIVEKIKLILDLHNPFVQNFRQISQLEDLQRCKLIIKEMQPYQHQYSLPSASEVAAVLVGIDEHDVIQQRDIMIQSCDGRLINVPDIAGYYDPLQYPLLLPHGSYGWQPNMYNADGQKISCRDYYSYTLQIRDFEQTLHLSGRLFQQYVVDNYVKIESHKLRFLRNNQNVIRAEIYKGLQDCYNAGETLGGNVGRKVILPSSYCGSPRDMYQRYQDAMALVQKFGKPDIFLTMTCNPSWEEITTELLPGQSAQDRPDLVTRVFRAKYEELKMDLYKKEVLGKVVANVHVVEFQKRGLPHAHLLIILDPHDKINTPDEYDCIVRAEIPLCDAEPELYTTVVKHMVHGPCGRMNPRSPCMKNGICKKKYPKHFFECTVQGNDSYPVYRRRDNGLNISVSHNRDHVIDNRWVVPYNPWLLLKYDSHLNVEICSSIKSVKYLYKYVYKGPDRVSFGVCAEAENDEIKRFMDARWVSPPEALWKIFSFALNKTYPSIERLQLHMPNQHQIRFQAHQSLSNVLHDDRNAKTTLTEFFVKNTEDPDARKYLYREFPEHYCWNTKFKCWKRRETNQRAIGRIYTASPTEGGRYYLRLLLNHVKGPKSLDELMTVNRMKCPIFKLAAEKLGLLESDDTIRECLLEATSTRMSAALRRLFVTMLIFCEPSGVRKLWDEFHMHMSEDYPSLSSSSNVFIINILLRDLDRLLSHHNKRLSDFDLPRPSTNSVDPFELPKLIQDELSITISNEDLDAISKLNEEQANAYNQIMESVNTQEKSLYFIDGPGGTGKTFLYRAILASIRSKGKIVIATATSGIASTLISGGRTTHSRFKIPIRMDSQTTCTISKQSDLSKLIQQASLIIWDEATMTHRHAFEALDRTLRDILSNDMPFGGKIFVFGGDFRQLLPVIPNGT